MNPISALISLTVAALTVVLWAVANQPVQEPAWPEKIQGFAFQPMGETDDPIAKRFPSLDKIRSDLELLAGKTHAVRTYSMEETLTEIPRLAREFGINVAVGAWLDDRLDKNEGEIERVIAVTNANRRNVVRVVVGNEAILRGNLKPAQVIRYLERVRAQVKVPVSTAEPWHVWLAHPELAAHADYLMVHMLPYWEGVDVDIAVDYIVARMEDLKRAFPGKPIVIGEVGWPSAGRTRHSAVASMAAEASFLRRFLARAEQEKYVYYVMEAFDQPWKRRIEAGVGAYWGVWDAQRQPKFSFDQPIERIPEWRILAGVSVLVALITFALLVIDSHTLGKRGRSFLAVVAFSAATAGVWTVYQYAHQYLTVWTVVVGVLLVLGMIGVIVVILTEAHEWAEARWVIARRRAFKPHHVPDDQLPMVSVHVPAYNEPADMMIETLNALSRLDYPRFEVVVIDNNTRDEAVWRPVEAHCAKLNETFPGHLGGRFRFFHENPLAGFKAGALNFALRQTDPSAEIVAVIDSDYQVVTNWLRDLVPQFANERIAVVQAPQDYRDAGESLFKAMCHAEYRGFFYIGMVTRNERNAIIQHGTMTMVRRSVLEEIGWGEWCITEDAELGLRIFERGLEATYIPVSYGQGLMPDRFIDFKKQRWRWAFGAMQILRHHTKQLFGRRDTSLTAGQRYHFIAGWLPWIADGFNLIFNMAAIAWSLGMLWFPNEVDPPMMTFAALPLVLFGFKGFKLLYLYRTAVKASVGGTLAAALAGLALSHTIALAVLAGFRYRDQPFLRTPKMRAGYSVWRALSAAREEGAMFLGLWAAAFALLFHIGTEMIDMAVWIAVLLIQSLPYAASVVMAGISGLPPRATPGPALPAPPTA
ncbi:MAG: glycosyltransferase [Chromatiales bacterium]|nr:glycosyltransferase [Gammaproteobacteria bacterium]MCP5230749.1 glycosyltransferase [Zoogloeaceae bacterium]MCP5351953.1 glycosyltransferase [Chromatiales bacterium]